MKFKLIVVFLSVALAFSCSNDEDQNSDSDAIVGTWFATELQIDSQTASDDAKNGRDALNFLTPRECFVIKFIFNQDLSVVAENSVNYIRPGVNEDGTGLDIPCPSEKDTENSTYSYSGTTLSIVDSNGDTIITTATVDGNTLSVDASGLDIPNFNASGQLIFRRQ